MGRKDTFKDLLEMVEEAADLIDENENAIRKLTGNERTLDLRQEDMLREVRKSDDEVLIISETEKEYDSFEISKTGGQVTIILDEKKLVANVPEDCNLQGVEAMINNNVLEVSIPRE